MDDPAADWALLGERPDLGHQVVPDFFLDFERAVDVEFVGVRLEVGSLLGCDHAREGLGFGERDPDAPPVQAFERVRPERAHLGGAVA